MSKKTKENESVGAQSAVNPSPGPEAPGTDNEVLTVESGGVAGGVASDTTTTETRVSPAGDTTTAETRVSPAADTTTAETSVSPAADTTTAEASVSPTPEAIERTNRTRELVESADRLKNVAPNSYQAWRTQADVLLEAIKQLERREIDPDSSVVLMGIPLLENDLRDAAEQALRHCAHFATTFDERIALIDEANSVRRTTWF